VSGATSYIVQYWPSGGSIKSVTVTSASYTITGLNPGTSYQIQVCASNSAGSSGYCSPIAVATQGTGLAAPTGFRVTTTSTSAILSWDARSDGASFTVYRTDSSGNTLASAPNIAAGSTSYTWTQLSPNTPYYFRLSATLGSVTSDKTETKMAFTLPADGPPPAPSGLAVSAATQSSITLTWNKNPEGATYTVYLLSSAGSVLDSKSGLSNATTTYTFSGLSASTTYKFYMTQTLYGQTSVASATVSGTTKAAGTLEAPSNFKVTGFTKTTVTLGWDRNGDGSLYTVTCLNSAGTTVETKAGLSNTTVTCTFTNLTAGAIYTFRITATLGASTSAYKSVTQHSRH